MEKDQRALNQLVDQNLRGVVEEINNKRNNQRELRELSEKLMKRQDEVASLQL